MLRNGIKPSFRFSGCLRTTSRATASLKATTPNWRTYSANAGPSSVPTPTKPYYVTTPIFYVNSVPHIGHLFSGVLADVLARYARLKDPQRDVHFLTGTDEHGLKIQRAAEEKGVQPKPFCDGISKRFEDLAQAAGLSHTRFIRTTEPVHYKAVEHLWRELLARGWIYKGSHSGWYSVSDEAFYAPNQLIDVEINGETVKVAKESGSRIEWMEEENYKFRLSAFREKLIEWLESNPRSIVPLDRWKEVHTLLAEHELDDKGEKVYTHPLEDLSISRPSSRLSWGIPVPDDSEHTIYVWIDALTNYITALGYPWSGNSSPKQAAWPADVQVIGVDIVRFHAIYWPAMLFALGLAPPKTLLTHGHWTMDNFKMSKSRGNVADPFKAIETYGADAVRYYLMRNAPLVTKSDWSDAQVKKHYLRDLLGMIGNLCNRINSEKLVVKLPSNYRYQLSGRAPSAPFSDHLTDIILCIGSTLNIENRGEVQLNEANAPVREILFATLDQFESKMDTLEVNKAVALVPELVERANTFFTQAAPWSETDPVRVAEAHLYAHQALHLAGILLYPVMPTKAAELLDRLGVQPDQRTWAYAQRTFGSSDPNERVLHTPWIEVIARPTTDNRPTNPLFPRLS